MSGPRGDRAGRRAGARAHTLVGRVALERAAWMVVGIALVVGAVGGLYRAVKNKPDWRDLQIEARYVWEHGHTAPGTAMFGYLPTATFVLWPFMVWTPLPVGATLYVASNVAAGVASIWIVRRWWRVGGASAGSFVWAVLLVSANLAHAIQANQLTMWTLLLCVAGLTLVERRGSFGGGLLVGLATCIKTMPGIFGVYLLLRRRWAALAGMVAALILFDAVPSVAFFGWRGALAEHRAWLRRAGWHSNWRQIDEPLLWAHRHGSNASYAAVLTRWLRAVPDVKSQIILYGQPPADLIVQTRATLAPGELLAFDPMPPREGPWSEKRVDVAWVPRFHLAALSARAVWIIWAGTLTAGFAALIWATWRTAGSRCPRYMARQGASAASTDDRLPGGASGGPCPPYGWPVVAALWMLAMFWPSPMARHYYLAWVFPAIAAVWRALLFELHIRDFRWSAGARLAAAALIAWSIGVLCLGWFLVRWYGIHLAALVLLTAATAWAWRKAATGFPVPDAVGEREGGPKDG
jgi:hypothetical protein